MAGLWPWLAVAGVGALHGLNPATDWLFAAASGVRSRDGSQALRALLPIAAGHAVSVALVATTVAFGASADPLPLQAAAAVLLLAVALHHLAGRRARLPAGPVALALWSFMVATTHGAGWMLVPALLPLCIGDGPVRDITASGSLLLALAAVAVHAAAMLAVTAIVASGACRGVDSLTMRAPWRRTASSGPAPAGGVRWRLSMFLPARWRW